MIRGFPLRWHVGDSARGIDHIREGGWFLGAEECVRVLAEIFPAAQSSGTAFGAVWPVLSSGGWLVAPAIPASVEVEGERVVGIDGEYHHAMDGIHRDAVGTERLTIATNERETETGERFDLLWFGEMERFVLRSGVLEIEDLFAACRVPASPVLLDKILVRGRRLDPEILAGLVYPESGAAPEVEVRRQAALNTEKRWRDAHAFLANRAGVDQVERDTSGMTLHAATGAAGRYELEELACGWRLERTEGDYPFLSFSVLQKNATLSLCATLAPEIDPLAPGMRGRLAFDLRSDLVALG